MLRPSDYEPGLGGAVLEAELDADFAAFNDWLFAQRGVRVAPQPAYEVVMQYTVAELEANWALVQLYMQDMSVTAGYLGPGRSPARRQLRWPWLVPIGR